MPTLEQRTQAVRDYAAAITAGSVDDVLALFAEDATVEDPVGSTTLRGQEQLRTLYTLVVDAGTTVELAGPPYGTIEGLGGTSEIAAPLTVHSTQQAVASLIPEAPDHLPDGPVRINSLDVMRFGSSGRITAMRAYWGLDNVAPGR